MDDLRVAISMGSFVQMPLSSRLASRITHHTHENTYTSVGNGLIGLIMKLEDDQFLFINA